MFAAQRLKFQSDQMADSFIFNDETQVNSYGFMVINSGGKFDRFKANPVMLHLHDQEKLTGKWANLRVDGSRLIADPIFDDADPEAKEIKGKVERGFLSGASMGILPLSAELKDIPGEGLVPVLTEWELLEGSTVPVPSNSMSLRLYNKEGKVLSSLDEVKLSIDSITQNKPLIKTQMDKIILSAAAATALAISPEATAEVINAAVVKLSADLTKVTGERDDAVGKLKTANDAMTAHLSAQATALVDQAISEGRITADKKESFVKLATQDFKQAKEVIEAMPKKKDLSSQVGSKSEGAADRTDWNYMRWSKEDPKGLQLMATSDPDKFKALREGYKSNR